MTTLAIAIHVIAAILLVGPVMVSTSMFPAQIANAQGGNTGALSILHRITKTYGLFSAIVPVLGVAVFLTDLATYGKQGQFHASIALAIVAWALLIFVVIPKQKAVVAALGGDTNTVQAAAPADKPVDLEKSRSQIAMFSGIFNLLWIIIAILMFI
ncbi:DUF2269 domain-containing protein [Corynebacterium phoceense]|uniref:DUF2269 domain-containing protein n=1 Tax=Corynebacterium phoceense TaxID=1686286 RepID=UPI00211B888D|nr:DUF2269 domain-containing protein [Corynebacterium phoceense]MCQ9330167.1 DUF2269 domain-containing protein [Corynebacterium phoceense]MCQ9347324.1 DUF2269 domain-containing protein [Corynebacterium phoceense]